MMHCITLLLSWANLITCARHSGNSVSKFNSCCMYHVYWVAFILVGQFALGNIFACLRVQCSWWLVIDGYYYYRCLIENQQ